MPKTMTAMCEFPVGVQENFTYTYLKKKDLHSPVETTHCFNFYIVSVLNMASIQNVF
jgi:hypothetical protein